MFAKIAVSVAIAFLCASPLASASGLSRLVDPYRGISEGGLTVTSGIIVFFLAICLIGPTLRLVHKILETLSRVEERPKPIVALTMLVLGTLCAISAMFIQYNAGFQSSAGVSMNVNGFGGKPQMVMQSSSSLGLGISTSLTFLLGTSLIALGIWSCLKPVAPSMIKPSSREFDEVAT